MSIRWADDDRWSVRLMEKSRASERLQLAVFSGPTDAERRPAFRLVVPQADLVKSATQRNVAGDRLGAVVAIVVDHHFIVDSQDGSVVRLDGEPVEAVRLHFDVAFEPHSVVHRPAELLEVERAGISGRHWTAALDVLHRGECPLEQRERQSRLRNDA